MLKQGVPYQFTDHMEIIVNGLLQEFSKPPVLVFPDWDAVEDGSRLFQLYCDSSLDGLGVTLEARSCCSCSSANTGSINIISEGRSRFRQHTRSCSCGSRSDSSCTGPYFDLDTCTTRLWCCSRVA